MHLDWLIKFLLLESKVHAKYKGKTSLFCKKRLKSYIYLQIMKNKKITIFMKKTGDKQDKLIQCVPKIFSTEESII